MMASSSRSSTMTNDISVLLNPVTDPVKCLDINIAAILQEWMDGIMRTGEANFNEAALVIQGSAHIYGKKVEHVYSQACSILDTLHQESEINGNDERGSDPKKSKVSKPKTARQNKILDPFGSTAIKPGKNLSCLTKNDELKKKTALKKNPQKIDKKNIFVPLGLLALDDDRGDLFYDTNDEVVGYKNDFMINKSMMTSDGWLLLPPYDRTLIDNPTDDLITVHSDEESDDEYAASDVDLFDDFASPNNPDEGYPASSGCPSSAQSSQLPSTQATDEGLGPSLESTPNTGSEFTPIAGQTTDCMGPSQPMDVLDPCEGPSQQANDLGPMEVDEPAGPATPSSIPDEAEMERRKIEKQKKLAEKRQKKKAKEVDKPIGKGNTICLPKKLLPNYQEEPLCSASEFCATHFFSPDLTLQKTLHFQLRRSIFTNNSKFINKLYRTKELLEAKGSLAKNKTKELLEAAELENRIETQDDVPDYSEPANPGLRAEDIIISSTHVNPMSDRSAPLDTEPDPDFDPIDQSAPEEIDTEADYNRLALEHMHMFQNVVQKFTPCSKDTDEIKEWRRTLAPFLKEINSRERFDINKYGACIIDAFPQGKGRQTILFKDFCKDMEKWEIHRYFIALLPLANVGNVDIQTENEKGEMDISITLLSRKMHHLELENFGHGTGEHE